MFYSRLLYCMVWVLGICLLVTGAFGPMFGMNLAVAHYMLLAAISLYVFKKFIMWLNLPYYAAARLDENHTLQPIKSRQLLMLPFAAWFAFFPCTLVASPLPVGPATDWGKITAKDGRVVPCINSSKKDIRLVAHLFPWAIEKIRNWEREVRAVSRLQVSTFFHQSTTPGATGPTSIDEVVRWSRTLHGGKRFDLLAYTSPPTSDVCIYAGGLCE